MNYLPMETAISQRGGRMAYPDSLGLLLLESRDRIRFYYFDHWQQVPLPDIARMVHRAWGCDYRDRAIFKFDEEYLRWLMPEGFFCGIWAVTQTGETVGFEIALDRYVAIGERRFRTSYVTLLSVLPELRGKGIAQTILRCITRAAIELRGSELVMSVFDANAAGRPTVGKFLNENAEYDWSMKLSSPYSVWASTPALRTVHKYEPFRGLARVALLPGLHQLLEFHQGTTTVVPNAPRAAVDPLMDRAGCAVMMELTESLPAMYRESHSLHTGMATVPLADGKSCCFAVHLPWVTRPGLTDRRVAQIQMVHGQQVSKRQLIEAFRSLNSFFFNADVLCSIFTNTAGYSSETLFRSGFLPSERKVCAALRGSRDIVEKLGNLQAPWFIDVL